MATEQEIKEPELDEDLDEGDGSEPEPKVELEVPKDPNEPIEVPDVEAQKASRREKRAQRQNEFKRLQQEAESNRREIQELRSRQQQYQAPPQQQVNPVQQRLQQIDQATAALHERYELAARAPGFTKEHQAQFEQEARNLQTARMAAVAQASAPQVDMNELVRRAAWHAFTTEHSDVFHDPDTRIAKWAWAEYDRRIAEGQKDTKDMVEEILDRARIQFGKQPRKLRGSAPDQATRQRLSGVRSGGSVSGGSNGGTIKMGPHEKRMARIAFGDKMSEKEAYQKWANTVGKKLQAEKG